MIGVVFFFFYDGGGGFLVAKVVAMGFFVVGGGGRWVKERDSEEKINRVMGEKEVRERLQINKLFKLLKKKL